jgi:hypothetical protein
MKLHHTFIFNTFDIQRLLWQHGMTSRVQKMSQNLSRNFQFSGILFCQQSIYGRYFEQTVKISSALMHWLHFCYELKIWRASVPLYHGMTICFIGSISNSFAILV